jgi:alpha-glucosidase
MLKQKHLWWQTGVIYQIYPRSFKDTNANGVGDLRGIISKLDYLSEILGVDAIWLSPFYPSPMKDFGYDVSNYTDVDPLFGDLSTFELLLAEAHQRGIKIIIDLVPNHTSDQHPWFQESCSSQDNPKRDWYIWANPKPISVSNKGEHQEMGPPNNWLSVFGGSAWEWDEHTGQYYLHSFLKEQPDLNWRNPEVKNAMFNVVRFWLDRGVDGFRVDVAHYIMKDPDKRDNPTSSGIAQSIHRPLGEYDTQYHIYDKGHPDNHQIYREFRMLLDEYSRNQPRMAIGEIHIYDWEEWVSYYGRDLDELHMPFNFHMLGAPWEAQVIRKIVDKLEDTLPPGAWPNYVFGNHDESRLASRIGSKQSRVAAMLLLTLRGTPTIYYGEEIGMKDVYIPRELQKDPAGLRQPGQGRDPCRTPMQWDASPSAGFSAPKTDELWLPLADDYHDVNVEAQMNDPISILSLCRALLTIRKSYPALQCGDYNPVDDVPLNCFAYLRREEDQFIFIALNFSTTALHLSIPNYGSGECILSTYLDRNGIANMDNLFLRGDEGLMIKLDE